MEGGQGPSRPPEIRASFEVCGAATELTTQLMELATRTKEAPQYWWQSQSDATPTWFTAGSRSAGRGRALVTREY